MVKRGFKEVIGSWKIMEIWFPLTFLISELSVFRRSCPLKLISPATILPGGLGTSLRIDKAVTLFPQPDSPTMLTVSPLWRVRSTPSTALLTPSWV